MDPTHDDRDPDSDLEELHDDMHRFEQAIQASIHQDNNLLRPGAAAGAARRHGSRKPTQLRGDIKARLSHLNLALIRRDYEAGRKMAFEIIRINAETVQAWSTLGSIFREQREFSKALKSMVYAAHLRPKDVHAWLRCAEFALEIPQEDGQEDAGDGNLKTAGLCYSAAIRANPASVEARRGRAAVCHLQGHIVAAVAEYNHVLQHCPLDMDVVRRLAEACMDAPDRRAAVPSAIAAYIRCSRDNFAAILWDDIGTYAGLHASVGEYPAAIRVLKSLARRLAGRETDTIWEPWQQDDSEWDLGDGRRRLVPGFNPAAHAPETYGQALPLHLRARLAVYRLRIGNVDEAASHLGWLQPSGGHTRCLAEEFPFLVLDIANGLFDRMDLVTARGYYRLILQTETGPASSRAAVLLRLGQCHAASSDPDPVAAEDCFLAAIEADDGSVDARIELAKLYETAREDEEALILITEAIMLQEAHDNEQEVAGVQERLSKIDPRRRGMLSRAILSRKQRSGGGSSAGLVRRRYMTRRLADPERRRLEDQERSARLTRQYCLVGDLKRRIHEGEADLMTEWVDAASDLVDSFRSLREFYSWERYLQLLAANPKTDPQQNPAPDGERNPLDQMVQRLQKNMAGTAPHHPATARQEEEDGGAPDHSSTCAEYLGIPFADWLTLFLDYAIGLALLGRKGESSQVCEFARDCVAFRTEHFAFLIHVAWCACALIDGDEDRFVLVAREFMRDSTSMSDPSRMFALLCRLYQSPASWYASGPTQKYIMRQIRIIDLAQLGKRGPGGGGGGHGSGLSGRTASTSADMFGEEARPELDVCLLMLYGHILFTSTSYTFALNYFLRALALDPTNPMISLSVGLCYIHYALKRQSGNRQYSVAQGMSFILRYFHVQAASPDPVDRQAAYFDVARTYHLLGLHGLAEEYYLQSHAPPEAELTNRSSADLKTNTAYNRLVVSLLGDDMPRAMEIVAELEL